MSNSALEHTNNFKRPRIAMALEEFLPNSAIWIWRQASSSLTKPNLILCHNRSNATLFPFEPCTISPSVSIHFQAMSAKLWPIAKYFPPRLTRRNKEDFRRSLIEHNIHAVHAHFGTVGTKVAPLCKSLGIPLIVTAHGFDISAVPQRWPAYRKALHGLFKQCKYIIAISNDMARQLKNMGCESERIRVCYLGVPIDEFTFVERRWRRGPVRFLHVGRLVAKKGVPDLVRAFALAFPKSNSTILDIVGDGPERDIVKQVIQKVKPANPVNLHGEIPHTRIPEILHRADVFVLNSRRDALGTTEGLPISILEAAATGLPVISTRHAGIPEAVLDGETGSLVGECDNDDLSLRMVELMDPSLRARWGNNARTYMKEKFSLKYWNSRLANIYMSLSNLDSLNK
jgi:glycosyltransferase involved in cell wall biosynthesis